VYFLATKQFRDLTLFFFLLWNGGEEALERNASGRAFLREFSTFDEVGIEHFTVGSKVKCECPPAVE
jgi:hypothetical protein